MSIRNINQIKLNYDLNSPTSTGAISSNLVNFAQVLNQVTSGTETAANYSDISDVSSNSGQSSNSLLKTNLEDIFAKAAETYNVPEDLLKAVAKAESGFNPNATSKCGAMGVMQLMPATAQSLGVTNAYDPEQNIMAGAKYLSQKLDTYDGDITLALASYNAGSGNVAKYGGVPPFPETQNYIKKILGYMGQDLEVPEQVDYNSGATYLAGASQGNTQTLSEMDSEKAYYLTQLQILQHQLEMQEIFASNFDEKNEEKDTQFNNLSSLLTQA